MTVVDGFPDMKVARGILVRASDGVRWRVENCLSGVLVSLEQPGDLSVDWQRMGGEGFGVVIEAADEGLRNFGLGPDGRIYGTTGGRELVIRTPKRSIRQTTVPGTVFRLETDGSRFEVIHAGLVDPQGIAFDDSGNVFTVDRGSGRGDQARLVCLFDGGDSGWRQVARPLPAGCEAQTSQRLSLNEWVAEHMGEAANTDQPAWLLPAVANLPVTPTAIADDPGFPFPESESGALLVADCPPVMAQSGIWSCRVEPFGAGFRLVHARPICLGLPATEIGYSWKGSIIARGLAGASVRSSGPHAFVLERTGVPVVAKSPAEPEAQGFARLQAVELLEQMGNPDRRVRTRAQLALAVRPEAGDSFAKAIRDSRRLVRLHGVWGLGWLARHGQSGSSLSDSLLSATRDEDDAVRGQAIRMCGDAALPVDTAQIHTWLDDPSPRVRALAAITAGKLRAKEALDGIVRLLQRDSRADPWLRHAGVFALSTIGGPATAIGLLGNPSPDVRLAAVIVLRRERDGRVAAFLADEDQRVVEEAIRAIHDLNLEDAWPAAALLLQEGFPFKPTPVRNSLVMRRLLECAFRAGGDENARCLWVVAGCRQVDSAVRADAIRWLGQWADPPPTEVMPGRWKNHPRRDATAVRRQALSAVEGLAEDGGVVLAATLEMAEQLGIGGKVPGEPRLREVIESREIPDDARTKALDLLVGRQTGDTEELLGRLVEGDSDSLAVAAMRHVAGRQGARALLMLRAARKSESPARRMAAWKLLGSMPGGEAAAEMAAAIDELGVAGVSVPETADLLKLAKLRKEPVVADSVDALRQRQAAVAAAASDLGRLVPAVAPAAVPVVAPAPRQLLPLSAWLSLALWFVLNLRLLTRGLE